MEEVIQREKDLVYRLAFSQCHQKDQADDIFQNVMYRYMKRKPVFESLEHEKAWFIRVTINACRDLIKSFFRSRTVSIDEILNLPYKLPPDNREILEAILSLPSKYKDVVYLHYYEGYTAVEIGKILRKNVNTVYTLLTRSRQMLKEKLGDIDYE